MLCCVKRSSNLGVWVVLTGGRTGGHVPITVCVFCCRFCCCVVGSGHSNRVDSDVVGRLRWTPSGRRAPLVSLWSNWQLNSQWTQIMFRKMSLPPHFSSGWRRRWRSFRVQSSCCSCRSWLRKFGRLHRVGDPTGWLNRIATSLNVSLCGRGASRFPSWNMSHFKQDRFMWTHRYMERQRSLPYPNFVAASFCLQCDQ